MQDEDNIIDVGEADEQEQEIDLDAEPQQEQPEEEIQVEEETDSEPEVNVEQREEMDDSIHSVKKRIAKLKRKMREAERQKEEDISYAPSINEQAKQIRGQYDQLGGKDTNEYEAKVETRMHEAKLT